MSKMDFVTKLAFIAAGGALGSVARFLVNVSPIQRLFSSFPSATFTVNIVGSFLIGFLLIIFADRITISENLRFAVMVGFLGAFTTFSTFELEVWGLIKEDNYLTALAYVVLSVALGFFGLIAGVWLARKF